MHPAAFLLILAVAFSAAHIRTITHPPRRYHHMSIKQPTPAERQRAYRDRLRGGPPREPEPCGTVAAARRHQRAHEPLDDACRKAWRAYRREIQRANRARRRGAS